MYILVFFSNFVPIRLEKCCDLENRVRGPSRSFEISHFDTAHTTSYWRSIVTMALSRVVSEIFNVEKCRDLEIGSKVTQGHRKCYHSAYFSLARCIYIRNGPCCTAVSGRHAAATTRSAGDGASRQMSLRWFARQQVGGRAADRVSSSKTRQQQQQHQQPTNTAGKRLSTAPASSVYL